MRYQVGDKVKVRQDLAAGNKYRYNNGYLTCSPTMTSYSGKIATIVRASETYGVYEINIDNQWDYWCEDMFEPVSKNKYKIKGL